MPFVQAVLELAAPFGDSLRPKFRICDTLGLGLPYEAVAWPRSVPRMVRAVRALGVRAQELEFHPHNDTHLVVTNCLAAVLAGCGAINGTLLGKGERSGNAPLEGVLLHLIGMDYFQADLPDFKVLNTLNDLYSALGQGVPAKYPLFGRDAHRTRAGIHADGLNKFWPMYAPFDVPTLLGRPLELSLTKDSGLAGLIFVIKAHTGTELSKDDPRLKALHTALTREFDAGRRPRRRMGRACGACQPTGAWERISQGPLIRLRKLDHNSPDPINAGDSALDLTDLKGTDLRIEGGVEAVDAEPLACSSSWAALQP